MKKIKEMNPSSSKNSITLTKWRDCASNRSSKMRRSQVTKESKDVKRKRLFNFKEFNQFQMRFSPRFLKRVFTRKQETK
jgi:hypothetical protein